MVASAHVLAGAVSGTIATRLRMKPIAQMLVALLVGVVSHVLMDAVPHSDYAFLPTGTAGRVGVVEALLTFGILALVARRRGITVKPMLLLAGTVGATSLDAKFGATILLPSRMADVVRDNLDAFHAPFHASPPRSWVTGLMLELATMFLLALILRALHDRGVRPASSRA